MYQYVTAMVRITLTADILASGGGISRHLVSRNRMPPNDIVLTTITHSKEEPQRNIYFSMGVVIALLECAQALIVRSTRGNNILD